MGWKETRYWRTLVSIVGAAFALVKGTEDGKIDASWGGDPSTLCPLDGDGLVPVEHMPGDIVAQTLVATAVKTTDYTAVVGDRVLVDTATTGSVIITMPSSPAPAQGDRVGICSVSVHASRTLTVAGGGANVQTVADDGFDTSTIWSQITLISVVYEFITGYGWVRVQ